MMTQRGVSLVELLVAMGLTSGLVLMDLERQQNTQVNTNRQMASESLVGVETDLRNWLRQEGTIEESFGNGVGAKRVLIHTGDPLPTVFDREADINGNLAITSIRIIEEGSTTPIEVLSQGSPQGSSVLFLGHGEGGNIRSLDGRGWAYIRTMWIQEFQAYDEPSANTDGDDGSTPETELRRGSANLKVLIWKFTNLLENPGYDCITNNNCEREVLTIPLDLRVVKTANSAEGQNNVDAVVDGTFGLSCRILAVAIKVEDLDDPCNANEFFDITDSENTADPSDPVSIGKHRGRCCRFVQ